MHSPWRDSEFSIQKLAHVFKFKMNLALQDTVPSGSRVNNLIRREHKNCTAPQPEPRPMQRFERGPRAHTKQFSLH